MLIRSQDRKVLLMLNNMEALCIVAENEEFYIKGLHLIEPLAVYGSWRDVDEAFNRIIKVYSDGEPYFEFPKEITFPQKLEASREYFQQYETEYFIEPCPICGITPSIGTPASIGSSRSIKFRLACMNCSCSNMRAFDGDNTFEVLAGWNRWARSEMEGNNDK